MQYNKIINLKLAIKKLDGVLVKPGETFSYWRLIGKPTRRKGYVDGMVLSNGGFGAGIGGGLCQLSNHRKQYSRDDVLIKDEFISENHAIMMYQPFLEEKAHTSEA